ncbi:hypothetical protein BASA81_015045 [Batrachochytrium salamandrivorans]|nr:hypothetical protein BASA81_015045 [Batrachochytrium salamandrivorans]
MEQVNSTLAQGKLVLVVVGEGEGECFPNVSTVHLPSPPPGLFPSRFSLVSPTGKRLFETNDLGTAREELAKLCRCFQPAPTRLSVSTPEQPTPRVKEFPPTTLLATVLDEFGCELLLGKYPKREYTLQLHGDQTLQALGLVDNVALVGKSSHHQAITRTVRMEEFRVVLWLLALWNWLFPVAPPVVVEEPEAVKKNNEYWNGDSTVFESPPD